MIDPAKEIYTKLNAEADIQNLIQGQVENLYVDFKTKFDHSVKDVDPELQKVLSKAISGFANADGGVIVLGVDAPQNQTPTLKPINHHVEFEQEVNSYISRATSFAVQGVEVKSFSVSNPSGGIVIVYVPKSDLAPHCSLKDKKYYQRVGDSFIPMEHYQLADMFGKRHQPVLFPNVFLTGDINTRGKIELVLGIRNVGRSVARFLLLEVSTTAGCRFDIYGVNGNGHFGLDPYPSNYSKYRGGADIVIHPGTDLPVTRMNFQCQMDTQGTLVHPPADIIIGGILAADAFSVRSWRLVIPRQTIQNIVASPRSQSANLDGELI